MQPYLALALQFGTGPAANAVEKIVFTNLDQAGRSERLDYSRQRRADEAMLVAAAAVIVSGDFTA